MKTLIIMAAAMELMLIVTVAFAITHGDFWFAVNCAVYIAVFAGLAWWRIAKLRP